MMSHSNSSHHRVPNLRVHKRNDADLTFRPHQDSLRNQRKAISQPFDVNAQSYDHNIYVPYVSVDQKPIPSGIGLMNEKVRFYLKPTPASKVDTVNKDGVSINTSKHSRMSDSKGDASEPEAIDLGTVQLRRIIEQIRGLKSNSNVNTFDPLASRKAGLPTYCDYLHGKQTADMTIEQLLKALHGSDKGNKWAAH
jgi:hypothetical protein